ncbi:hypothetical protein TVAG_153750 [Trichomonas vaginalis G3]|uniref:Uncharacterized protein n=1 Tax=Trichomonas vaginalis (strain ATCC PRA-98 / G3) TaxID=412133 RepID=A2EPT0_TRIV3|nr:hypothetical protein TVAGG3_0352420 [Trichomonas vaginalis G3]EAY05341.1 hypothetical protein TVAG_153750 [Trichomonas vaginalis G3]KAI5531382.1 hypothetical protein TVAGG3_0352420 [Trichomonas vaginalis G3]|eukprot:XP_001317564.1 hypothetical protein [Trichomonas vaginalis G3]
MAQYLDAELNQIIGDITNEINTYYSVYGHTGSFEILIAFWNRISLSLAKYVLDNRCNVIPIHQNNFLAFIKDKEAIEDIKQDRTLYGADAIFSNLRDALQRMDQEVCIRGIIKKTLGNVLTRARFERLSVHGIKILDYLTPRQTASISQFLLASLICPHRQLGTPTCNMNAIINAEATNLPARLAMVYLDLLVKDPDEKLYMASEDNYMMIRETIQYKGKLYIKVSPKDPEMACNQIYLLRKDGMDPFGFIYMDHQTILVTVNSMSNLFLGYMMENVYTQVPVIDAFILSRKLPV